MQVRRWHIYPSTADLEMHTARAVSRAATQAIETSGRFTLVLAGGSTPQRVYTRLAAAVADWARWHIYFGDERCQPTGDPQRNDRMAREAWLDRVAIPSAQVHSISAELGAVEAARRYAAVVASIECFDLVLLGLGEDGHTASLFPGHAWDSNAEALAVHNSPKPPPERVSLSAARLSRAQQVMFIVSGAGKQQAIRAWRRGDALPASAIVPRRGVDIVLDADAWPGGEV